MKKSVYRNLSIIIVLSIVAILAGCAASDDDTDDGGTPVPESTFDLSGTVTLSSGGVLQDVTITLSGTSSGTATTDADGNYSLSGLKNGSYTITPTLAGYVFNPASQAVTFNGADVTAEGFIATATSGSTYSISGAVTKTGGEALSDVTMKLSGRSTGTVTTSTSGNYSFTGLVNGSYTVIPSLTGYTFTPISKPVTITGANVTSISFTATANPVITYSISGTITKSGGGTLQGVTMTLSGADSGTTTTGADGSYTFSNLANGSYTLTPSISGYTFTPASRSVTIGGANVTATNFTATASSVTTYSISGTITNSGGGALQGVTMTLSGAGSGTATTNASGNFTFSGLANGNYTITPTLVGYTFTDASKAVTVNSSDVTGADFIATANISPTYSISGTITKSTGGGLSGVTVTLSGSGSGTATTDASGNFTFTGRANGSYTVTPSLAGYTFIPKNKLVTINGANVTSISFTATTNLSDPITSLLNSLVSIPAGSFQMGSTESVSAQPVHTVTLQGFKMSRCEITQAQYKEVTGNDYYWAFPGPNNPMEYVTWYDAMEFCKELSEQTGRTFMLPSEAQWEYACRAGSTTLYSFGDDEGQLGNYAWWEEGGQDGHSYGPQPVGTKLPNAWGLYDMHGNVWEWCLDSWHWNYTGAPNDGSAWEPEINSDRMLRGGCWNPTWGWGLMSADRDCFDPSVRTGDFGFRIVEIP